ncbi:MAG TPA: DegV family protein [Candidatus Enterenecus stercoripullorum]|nr:DegV family protein [Candidatus Enterenecus stercoripullorum]
MSFKIIVDSCCDLTQQQRASGLYINVPLTIYVGEAEYRDDETLDTELLTDAMAMCEQAAHTACPSPAEYLSAYEAAEGDVYVVTLSALLSGSHNSAWQAAQLFREQHPDRNLHVFNSCSASAGETLVAEKIARLAGDGLPFAQVVAETDRYIAEMNTLFVLENLDTLRKAGRLTKTQALITGALRVKLVMGSTPEGEIRKHTQALSIKQALSKLTDLMVRDERHHGKTLCISHCLCRERAEYLRMLARKNCNFSEILITETRGISTFYANSGGIIAAY